MSSSDFTEVKKLLQETWTAWQPWMKEAKTDLEYYLGKLWSDADKAYLAGEGRNALVINKNTRRFINLLVGYQRQNKLALNFKGVEGMDDPTAQDFTDLATFHLEKAKEGVNGYHQVSRAFGANTKVGLDWVNIYTDYEDDMVNGDIRFKRVPWTKMLPDPLFQEIDTSDMNYLFRVERLSKRQLKMMLDGKNVDEFPKSEGAYGPFMFPQALVPDQDHYDLTEFWERTYKKQDFLINRETGEIRPYTIKKNGKEQERLNMILAMYPMLKAFKKRIPDIQLQMFIGDKEIYKGPNPVGCEGYPYVPIMCYWDPEYEELKLKLQGILRQLRDSANELNKRRSQMLDVINTCANSGWMWEEGAMADTSQMDDASGQGVQIELNADGLNRIKPIDRGRFPVELFKMEELFAQDPVDITGINAELLSMVDKDIPGVLAQLRQRQGLVIIQEIFDNLRVANKCLGNRFAACVRNNYNAQKIARIIGRMPAPAFFTKEFGRYDTVVDEALASPTQKEALFHKLMWFHQNVAPMHPMILLDAADIPQKYKDIQMQIMMSQMGGGVPLPPGGKGPGSPSSSPAPQSRQIAGGQRQ